MVGGHARAGAGIEDTGPCIRGMGARGQGRFSVLNLFEEDYIHFEG